MKTIVKWANRQRESIRTYALSFILNRLHIKRPVSSSIGIYRL